MKEKNKKIGNMELIPNENGTGYLMVIDEKRTQELIDLIKLLGEEKRKHDIEEIKHRYTSGFNDSEKLLDEKIIDVENKLNEVIRRINEMGKSE